MIRYLLLDKANERDGEEYSMQFKIYKYTVLLISYSLLSLEKSNNEVVSVAVLNIFDRLKRVI